MLHYYKTTVRNYVLQKIAFLTLLKCIHILPLLEK